MCENEPNMTFLTLAMTFRVIQSNPALHSSLSLSWETFWPLKNNLYSDSTKSLLWYVVNVIPQKLHAKKEKQLLKRFWDWPFLSLSPLKVDAADADDGRVGLWKAPMTWWPHDLMTSWPHDHDLITHDLMTWWRLSFHFLRCTLYNGCIFNQQSLFSSGTKHTHDLMVKKKSKL